MICCFSLCGQWNSRCWSTWLCYSCLLTWGTTKRSTAWWHHDKNVIKRGRGKLTILKFQKLTLSLPFKFCSWCNFFKKQSCRQVKPTENIDFLELVFSACMNSLNLTKMSYDVFLADGEHFATDIMCSYNGRERVNGSLGGSQEPAFLLGSTGQHAWKNRLVLLYLTKYLTLCLNISTDTFYF